MLASILENKDTIEEIKDVKGAIETFNNLKAQIEKESEDNSFGNSLTTNGVISGLWFRGELDYRDKGLTPSIFRKEHNKKHSETKMCSYLSVMHEDIRNLENRFDKLCMMRHYEIKCRILDWTESFLHALYFAVQEIKSDKNGKSDIEDDKDGLLFCLNATNLNKLTGLKGTTPNIHDPWDLGTDLRTIMAFSNTQDEWGIKAEKLLENFDWEHNEINKRVFTYTCIDKNLLLEEQEHNMKHKKFSKKQWNLQHKIFCTPVAVRPNRVNQRMILQNSVFTLHGGKVYHGNHDDPSDNKKLHSPIHSSLKKIQEDNNDTCFLKTLKIPKGAKHSIKKELMNLGIHQGSLFPELDKQAGFLLTL